MHDIQFVEEGFNGRALVIAQYWEEFILTKS